MQLDIFGQPSAGSSGGELGPAVPDPELETMAAALPRSLHLGTSSWSFPGWEGLVYDRKASVSALARRGLEAYARHPLFRTVGVDRSFYAPVERHTFERYAEQVPSDFRFLVKAHRACTSAREVEPSGGGPPRLNARFLDPAYARDLVVAPFVEGLGTKAGVLLFQFSPQALAPMGGPRGFPDRLFRFFDALPRLEGACYAVELRNAELFTPRYVQALKAAGVEHCLNALPGMQSLSRQYAATGGADRARLVVRWMLHPKHDYQGAKLAYAPFDRIIDEDAETRGELVSILGGREGQGGRGRPAAEASFLIVNNKAEGSSPASIRRLVESLTGRR